MRARRLAAAAALAAALGSALGANAAFATDPVDIGSDHVTDSAGVLSSSEKQSAEERLAELADNTDMDLFVVYVDEYTNPTNAEQWTLQVAEANSLGQNDYLLTVAVDQRAYVFSADESGPISVSQQDRIQNAIEDQLSQVNWAAAITAAADTMQGNTGAGGSGLSVLLVIAVIAIIALVIFFIVKAVKAKKRRERGAMPETPDPNDPYSTVSDADLATQAGSALVQTDDAVTSSREELGFAVAEFGEGATATFSGSIDAAATKLSEAFSLQQKLDDEVPDTAEQKRAWNIQIITLCDEADDLLEQNTEAFDALRELSQHAPEALEKVRTRRAALQPLVDGADAALQALQQTYSADALRTVAENPAQSRERLTLADRAIAEAEQAIAQGSAGEAAFAIRTAEQAVSQGEQLAGALTSLGADFAGLEQKARALIDDMQTDVAAAAKLSDPTGQLAAVAARTSTEIAQAGTGLEGTNRDPRKVFDALTAANTAIDDALAKTKQVLAQTQRAKSMLATTQAQADAQIRAARDFIQTRRGAVGAPARTRLADAEASAAQSIQLAATDPVAALAAANRALSLAREATASAEQDLSSGGYGGGWQSGVSSSGSGMAGDIIGGIIGGLLAGGGSRRSGSFGGFHSSGFGGSSRRSGFGGGSRRSSFGGFGGGRRSGGGRF